MDKSPTFDEWHVAKYGQTFDAMYCGPSTPIHVSLKKYMERTAEYMDDRLSNKQENPEMKIETLTVALHPVVLNEQTTANLRVARRIVWESLEDLKKLHDALPTESGVRKKLVALGTKHDQAMAALNEFFPENETANLDEPTCS